MFTKVCVLLLAIGLSQAVPHINLPDVGLMQFMIQSRDLSQDNPARSLSCFDYYLPVLNEVADQYKTDFSKCLDVASQSRLDIDDSTEEDRKLIDGAATDACTALSTCSKNTGSIPYFECYTNAGADNTKSMYAISANSSALLAEVREQYHLIDIDQYKCTNQSERTYVENTAATYEELNKCLSGAAPVPSETTTSAAPDTSSSAPETTESSSSAPETTESSSSAPETTESSSNAPETTESTASESDSTTTDSLKENMPEEDLSRIAQEQSKLKHMMEDLQKWLKRN